MRLYATEQATPNPLGLSPGASASAPPVLYARALIYSRYILMTVLMRTHSTRVRPTMRTHTEFPDVCEYDLRSINVFQNS